MAVTTPPIGPHSSTDSSAIAYIEEWIRQIAVPDSSRYTANADPSAPVPLRHQWGVFTNLKEYVSRGPWPRNPIPDAPAPEYPFSLELLLMANSATTGLTPSGHPYLGDFEFQFFQQNIPYLFKDGLSILRFCDVLEKMWSGQTETNIASQLRVLTVIRQMVFSAAVTSPAILWTLRQLLALHQRFGTTDELLTTGQLDVNEWARQKKWDPKQLGFDLDFFHVTGYLEKAGSIYRLTDSGREVFSSTAELPQSFQIDWYAAILAWFQYPGDSDSISRLSQWFRHRETSLSPSSPREGGPRANLREMDLAYHVTPLLLALTKRGLTKELTKGVEIQKYQLMPEMVGLLEDTGFIENGRVTALGERVFARGAGPAGIIHAYDSYLHQREQLLQAVGTKPEVRRSTNIDASAQANRRGFREAVRAIADFQADMQYRFPIVIEHAVGQGVAIQEYVARLGTENLRFFGADYEKAALFGDNGTQAGIRSGKLPRDMKLVQADIGEADKLIGFIADQGLKPEGAVMIVGAGFHEVRDKNDSEMIDMFRNYHDAGISLVFTESSDLTEEQMIETGFQTYHPVFRYFHLLSGQGLRSPWRMDWASPRASWLELVSAGGYRVLAKYSRKTRPASPRDLRPVKNPPLEMTFFCVPKYLTDQLASEADLLGDSKDPMFFSYDQKGYFWPKDQAKLLRAMDKGESLTIANQYAASVDSILVSQGYKTLYLDYGIRPEILFEDLFENMRVVVMLRAPIANRNYDYLERIIDELQAWKTPVIRFVVDRPASLAPELEPEQEALLGHERMLIHQLMNDLKDGWFELSRSGYHYASCVFHHLYEQTPTEVNLETTSIDQLMEHVIPNIPPDAYGRKILFAQKMEALNGEQIGKLRATTKRAQEKMIILSTAPRLKPLSRILSSSPKSDTHDHRIGATGSVQTQMDRARPKQTRPRRAYPQSIQRLNDLRPFVKRG